MTVGELSRRTGVAQPQISKHLVQLEQVGLISREGTRNSVPQPYVVLGVLDQLTGAARNTLQMQIAKAQRELQDEEQRADELAQLRARLKARSESDTTAEESGD